jgi:hypothetical protein
MAARMVGRKIMTVVDSHGPAGDAAASATTSKAATDMGESRLVKNSAILNCLIVIVVDHYMMFRFCSLDRHILGAQLTAILCD